MLVLDHLQVEKAREQQQEHEEHETRRNRKPQPEIMDLEPGIAQLDAGIDDQFRHRRDRGPAVAAA